MRLWVILAFVLVTSAWGAEPSVAEKLGVGTPGIHEIITEREGKVVSRVTISIPEGYSAQKSSPLVVVLHWGGEVTPFYGRILLELVVEPALRDLNAIFVAPDSVGGDWTTPANEESVLLLLDDLAASYNIDEERILLTGYSMGGGGTWYLAARHPDKFSAAIPMTAGPPVDRETPHRTAA